MNNTMVSQIEATVNGPEWDQEAGEYAVYLDGQRITWAETETAGWAAYSAARSAKAAHYTRMQNRVDLGVQYVA